MTRLGVLLFLVCVLQVSSIKDYDLTSFCGDTITIQDGAILLSYHSSSPIQPNVSCTVYIFSPIIKHPANVIAYFDSFYTDSSKDCVNSRLELFDDHGTDLNKSLTGPHGLCGSRNNHVVYYNSSQSFMTIMFRDVTSSSNFQATLTSAHTGSCDNDEYHCGNGFCISNSLICNGYNNCGNKDDLVACGVAVLTAGAIVAIVFGALVSIVLIPFVIVCLVCRPRRRRTMYRQV